MDDKKEIWEIKDDDVDMLINKCSIDDTSWTVDLKESEIELS